MANVTAQTLRPSKAPNLPIAPVEYSQQYQDMLNNALRLYFSQVDNFNRQTAVTIINVDSAAVAAWLGVI